ncbi:CobW C-terminal domain-containing protein, partial [Haematococcus lacustris]
VAETFTFSLDAEGKAHAPDTGPGTAAGAGVPSASVKAAASALRPLTELARLDTCVTVVDASHLLDNLASLQTLKEKEGDAYLVEAEDDRNVADLLLDQIEFADVILLNKCDTVSSEQLPKLAALLTALNPGARLLQTVNSQVDLHHVIDTGELTQPRPL